MGIFSVKNGSYPSKWQALAKALKSTIPMITIEIDDRPFQMRALSCITSYPFRGLPYLAYDNVNPAMVNRSMMLHSSMHDLKRSIMIKFGAWHCVIEFSSFSLPYFPLRVPLINQGTWQHGSDLPYIEGMPFHKLESVPSYQLFFYRMDL